MTATAFIGLGNMGAPMAANLLKSGHEVVGYDVNAAAMKALSEAGGRQAGSADSAAQAAEVVVTMLPAGEHVRKVYLGPGGLIAALKARSGVQPLLIDCSTIDVESARVVAAAAREAGFEMLDAPVSGGVVGATAGTLTFMVGGSDAAFARGEPILRAMGKNIVHSGGSGAGQAAKICNNMILGISMIAVSEAFVLADKLGLERQKLFEVSSTASGQCWSLTNYCPAPGPVPSAPSNRDYEPGFTAALMLKDLKLSQDAAEATGAATPLGAHAAALYQQLVEAGEAGRDFSVVFRWLSGLGRQSVIGSGSVP
jgi:3-hydroxyisobutyrate dehydrogenase